VSYTFILIARDSTNRDSLHIDVKKPVFWSLVTLFVLSPFMVGLSLYYWILPSYDKLQLDATSSDYVTLKKQVEQLRLAYNEAADGKKMAEDQLQKERSENASAQARIAITENMRATSSTRMQELEKNVLDLEGKLQFYRDLIQPEGNNNSLTCYNLDVTAEKGVVKYAMNWMRSAGGPPLLDATVRVRVLAGVDALNMNVPDKGSFMKTQPLAIKKESRLTGEIRVNIPTSGVRILDVRAFGPKDVVLGNCWKTF
jgi:hypothetical protein